MEMSPTVKTNTTFQESDSASHHVISCGTALVFIWPQSDFELVELSLKVLLLAYYTGFYLINSEGLHCVHASVHVIIQMFKIT